MLYFWKFHKNILSACKTSIVFICIIPCFAAEYEWQYTPSTSVDNEGFAHYKLYVPDDLDEIKGIYGYAPGWQGNSFSILSEEVYRNFVEKHEFALMAFHMEGWYTHYEYGASVWSAEALIQALGELAILSNHPEVEYAPMVLHGSSAGGQFAYHIAQYIPDRVIAFVTDKGGYHTLGNIGMAAQVPGYFIAGEIDLERRRQNMAAVYDANRLYDALWTFAIEPDAGHEAAPLEFVFSYLDEVIPLRIPTIYPSNDFPRLKEIGIQSGWLGNQNTGYISDYSSYPENVYDACWFPTEGIAREWRDFMQWDELTHIESDLIHAYPNPSENSVYIHLNGKPLIGLEYRIIDLSGKYVVSDRMEGYSIKTSGLKAGMYIIQLYVDSGMTQGKILVQ